MGVPLHPAGDAPVPRRAARLGPGVLLAVCASPAARDYDETARVLRYASLATQIGTAARAQPPAASAQVRVRIQSYVRLQHFLRGFVLLQCYCKHRPGNFLMGTRPCDAYGPACTLQGYRHAMHVALFDKCTLRPDTNPEFLEQELLVQCLSTARSLQQGGVAQHKQEAQGSTGSRPPARDASPLGQPSGRRMMPATPVQTRTRRTTSQLAPLLWDWLRKTAAGRA